MNLDYLVGRKVGAIVVPPKEGSGKWAIVFDDETRLIHTGSNRRPDNEIKDCVLGVVKVTDTQSVLEFYKGSPPELAATVVGQTDKFEIEWAKGSVMENIVSVEKVDPSLDLPPDPSPERVAEGPSEDFLKMTDEAGKAL